MNKDGTNIIKFPNSKITVEEIVESINEALLTGNLECILVTIVEKDKSVRHCSSSMTSERIVFMNFSQRQYIEEKMRE